MRRLIAIFLLALLPFQAVWAAVEPYCLHEDGEQSSHMGHHEHQHHADANSDHRASADETAGNASAMLDHEHHCCASASLLSVGVTLPGPLPPVEGVASPLASDTSFDATRIERPKWAVSL